MNDLYKILAAMTPQQKVAFAEEVVAVGERVADGSDTAADVEVALLDPREVTKSMYLALGEMLQECEQAVAMGRDAVPGFNERHTLIAEIMERSGWTQHPDHGVITKDLAEIRNHPEWGDYEGGSSFKLSEQEREAILRTTDPALEALRQRVAQPVVVTDRERDIFIMTKLTCRDGELEVDPDAVISEGVDNGAYVGCFKWIDFSGTHLDVDAQLEEEDQEVSREERQR